MMTALISVLYNLVLLLNILIFIRCIISFFPRVDQNHPVIRFIYTVTEPILAPFRAILPSTSIGIDLSPLLAIFVIEAIVRMLVVLLKGG